MGRGRGADGARRQADHARPVLHRSRVCSRSRHPVPHGSDQAFRCSSATRGIRERMPTAAARAPPHARRLCRDDRDGHITGGSDAAVAHSPSGAPPDCSLRNRALSSPAWGPQTGGLPDRHAHQRSQRPGFTFNAEALDGLAKSPFYRQDTTPIPTSIARGDTREPITWQGQPISPALGARRRCGQLVADALGSLQRAGSRRHTRSATEWVLTFPTRRFYVTPGAATAPFSPGCEDLAVTALNRRSCAPSRRRSACGLRLRDAPGDTLRRQRHHQRSPCAPAPPSVLGSFNNTRRSEPDSIEPDHFRLGGNRLVGPGPARV